MITKIESGFDWKLTRYDFGANIPLRFAKPDAMLAESYDYEGAVEQHLRVAWNFDGDRDKQAEKQRGIQAYYRSLKF